MRAFPGRTLEELDAIDYARYQRAQRVLQAWNVEEVRSAWIGKKISAKNVSPDMWEQIRLHDDVMGEVTEVDDGE